MTGVLRPQDSRNLHDFDTNLRSKDALVRFDTSGLIQESEIPLPCQTSTNLVTTEPTNDRNAPANDSDTDDDEQSAELPASLLTNAQRKRAQNLAFEDFIREHDEVLQQGAEKQGESPSNQISGDTVHDRRIIDQVRDYQSELFARAKAGNVIAVLDTGSGKTLIAALLLRDVLTQELEDRAAGKPRRTSFFLVSQKILALVLMS
jgi:endoribonuclease Dicer